MWWCVWVAVLAVSWAARPDDIDCFTSAPGVRPTLGTSLTDLGYSITPHDGRIDVCVTVEDRLDFFALANASGTTFDLTQPGGVPFRQRPPEGYHTPEELFAEFQRVASEHPGITRLINLRETYNTPQTWDGRDIYALKISDNVHVDEDEPNVLIVSNHHARELITPEIALDTILYLTAQYKQNNTNVQRIVDNHQVYVIYTMNPDGLHYVWNNNNMWRKNRRQNTGGSYGVDLNRNYPFGWDFNCGGSTNPRSETYKGPSAASEPETKVMAAFQEDRSFAKVLDYHSYAREVRINYGSCAKLPTVITSLLQDIATQQAATMSYKPAQAGFVGTQPAYAYHDHQALANLVETGTAFQPPGDQMKQEVERVRPGTQFYLALPIPVTGHVTSANTGGPVTGGRVVVKDIPFNYGEHAPVNSRAGRYHFWLPLGTWTLTASAPGHTDVTKQVTVTKEGVVVDFSLL